MRYFMTLLVANILTLSAANLNMNAGGGVWNVASEGSIVETVNQTFSIHDQLYGEKNSGYLFAELRHPLPILPNVRLEYSAQQSSGEGKTGALSTPFLGATTLSSTDIRSDLCIEQYDVVMFYRLLENMMWMSLDVGLDLKYVVSEYKVDAISVDEYSDSLTPLLYVRGRVDIPHTDLGVETDVRYITDGSSTLSDIKIKVDYTMTFIPVVHPVVEIGYRVESFDIDGEESAIIGPIISGNTDVDLTFSGLYGGVGLAF